MPRVKKVDPSAHVNDILKSLRKTKPAKEAEVDVGPEEDIVDAVVHQEIPRGRPKSGNVWKDKKERFNTIKKTKGVHKSFAEKQALRETLKNIKEVSKTIQAEKQAEVLANKERRRLNLKKTEENRLKAEIVQVISNSSKIKRMKKKQLKFIQKRDTTVVSK